VANHNKENILVRRDLASYLYPNWTPNGVQIAMATSPKAQCRLEPITHAYLEDLARLGAYGKGKSGVMRRFIERNSAALSPMMTKGISSLSLPITAPFQAHRIV
jgi:hypothetical protein